MKYCEKCGAEIPEGSKFCIKCGTPVPSEGSAGGTEQNYESAANESTANKSTAYEGTVKMGWYRFTIYVGVFIPAIIYIALAVLCATGYMYLDNRVSVYEAYPGMQALNIAMAAFYVIMALFSIVVRQSLAHYMKSGPRVYLRWLLASLIGWLSYDAITCMITGRFTIYIYPLSIQRFAFYLGIPLLVNVIYIVFNLIYFYRRDRKALFVN